MLICGALIITNLTTGCVVRQSCQTHCRIPLPSKVAVLLNERLFHTLLPKHPTNSLRAFYVPVVGRATGGKALAKHDSGYASDRSAKNAVHAVLTVGLEPGYRVDMRWALLVSHGFFLE